MEKEKTSIIFSGDVGFDKYMDKRWEDENLLSQELVDFFHSADHVCLNVEGAVLDGSTDCGGKGAYFHSMNPAAISVFNKIGADIWNIGNNHIMDAGENGLVSTKKFAEENAVKVVGAGIDVFDASTPVYLDEAGGIGIISVSYMNGCVPAGENEAGILRWDDMEVIENRIREIKEKCRWCVVIAHGGEEFNPIPSAYTRDRYIKYLEMGADAVVGHHPHVPENYEIFEDGKMIFYSLGNFIFDTDYQRSHLYTDVGVLVKLIFTEEKMEFEARGIKIVRGEERIEATPLPDIFTNINNDEYELLLPLAAKSFVEEEKRRLRYLVPKQFEPDTEEVWNDYFFVEKPYEYLKNVHMDFWRVFEDAKKSDEGNWEKSSLESVKKYILKLI